MKLLVLPGDGIGHEITQATLAVLDSAARRFELPLAFEHDVVGFDALKQDGSTFPDRVLDRARAADGILLGPVSHLDYPPREEGGLNPSGGLRIGLDLWANVRPARTRAALPSSMGKSMDLVIVRENTEGFYADRNMLGGQSGEFMPTADLALAFRKISRPACARLARYAFELAAQRRRKVTAVHKGNVMRVTDGLFLEETRRQAEAHPDVVYEEVIVDAMAAHLIRHPGAYDVIVTTNMFGDILSDEASELSGSLGLAGSLNAGDDHAMAQAQHGSAPDIAGQGVANPSSLILSAAMLLRWLATARHQSGALEAADVMEKAIDDCLSNAATRTPDLGGSLSTEAFTSAVVARVEAL